jgi:hypothetical protein
MRGNGPCPQCGSIGTVISGPKGERGLCVSCKTLVPMLHTRVPVRRRILGATLALITMLANVSSIDQGVRYWLPQRGHDPLKALIAAATAEDDATLALIAADQAAYRGN